MHPKKRMMKAVIFSEVSMNIFRIAIMLFFCASSELAFSWDGSVVGKIAQIDVASAENYGFRVTLKPSSDGTKNSICGNHTWGYLNKSSSNYETFVSVLLAAKMSQGTVTIYTNAETRSGNGYCHIGYIAISG